MLWCARYPGTLAARYRELVAEMRHRGFKVSEPEPRGDGLIAQPHELEGAREILIERLRRRIADMRREPRWTGRSIPRWVVGALGERAVF